MIVGRYADRAMQILPVTDDTLHVAAALIRDGGVVAHATETCYGLACDMTNAVAVERVFRIKQRPFTQPVSALFPQVEAAKAWVLWNARAEELAQKFLPGPLTLILPIAKDVALFPTPAGGATVGVRVSPHPVSRQLAELAGRPISTTSANVHGQPSPYDAQTIAAQYDGAGDAPDLVLDSGTLPTTPPSTILDLSGPGGDRALRTGSVPV